MIKKTGLVFVFILCAIFTGIFSYAAYQTYNYHKPVASSFPRIDISNGDVSIQDIKDNGKDVRYEATFAIDSENLYQKVELKGRGNSTFLAEKMPFQIKFSEKTELYGLGKSKKWVLLANYYDPSNLRNAMAYYLERLLGEQYALNGRFVELWYNDENQGLYYLSPKVEIGKDRVDLRDPMGILVEFDTLHNNNKDCHYTKYKKCLTISDEVAKDNAEVAMVEFMKSFNALIDAAKVHDFGTVSKLADVESLAIYYLLSEFTVNPDGYASSFFLYKDGPNDRIHAGPGWDFDFALGNRQWYWSKDEGFYSPTETQYQRRWNDGAQCDLFYNLTDTPEFMALVKDIFNERMSGKKDEMMAFFLQNTTEIKDRALYNNIQHELRNFTEEVYDLADWLSKRYDYFEQVYGYQN